LDEVEVLEFIPPGEKGTGCDVVIQQSQLELTGSLHTPHVMAWEPSDRVATVFHVIKGGGLSGLRQHQDVEALPLVGTSQNVFEHCRLHCGNIALKDLLKYELNVIRLATQQVFGDEIKCSLHPLFAELGHLFIPDRIWRVNVPHES
jgi:hypothetical protein